MVFIRNWLHGPSTVNKCADDYIIDLSDIDKYARMLVVEGTTSQIVVKQLFM